MNQTIIEEERKTLSAFFKERLTTLDGMIEQIGTENIDLLLLGLSVLTKDLENAANAARTNNLRLWGHYGAQAKFTKDQIYTVLGLTSK